MLKRVVELKPGDVIVLNGRDHTVHTLQYKQDNVHIRVTGSHGLNKVFPEFEKVQCIKEGKV